jgi:hypothetical protein
LGIAKAVDRLAPDVFHDEVGHSVGRGAGIEQARDVWVVEGRENAALGLEAPQDGVRVHTALDHLDGDVFL